MGLLRFIAKLFYKQCPKCTSGLLETIEGELLSSTSDCEREGLDAYRFSQTQTFQMYRKCDRCDYKIPAGERSTSSSYVDGM